MISPVLSKGKYILSFTLNYKGKNTVKQASLNYRHTEVHVRCTLFSQGKKNPEMSCICPLTPNELVGLTSS